ncbi:hypothetical protein FOXG_20362 [Fusarium oxysporum f. sp. lycopersici 4287]|uniref:Heterokaryon incompatibility domain-containing protein n=2 Tax=Fusarium oxysporum TaxID=5507 RepID=A0A0J9VIA9_FUSO4|nr:hypothetical protein FOXG_20362 [Fusarium oxysporum f. sp. lycopersici 4287]EXK40791.1 hypothetical protein FOMG_07532 [Fusarium oxysporum f. sp. melonis 26406]KNB10570.1 hypothetical protein FOXG_20362 [Fusarium oxysporum f. sp. lycopersici 4287]
MFGWAFAILRRIKIEEKLGWLFLSIRNSLGFAPGHKQVDQGSPPPPKREIRNPAVSAQGQELQNPAPDAENQVVAGIAEGINIAIPETHENYAYEDESKLLDREETQKLREHMIKGVEALANRIAPAEIHRPSTATVATVEDYDDSVPEYIISSLKVALPNHDISFLNSSQEGLGMGDEVVGRAQSDKLSDHKNPQSDEHGGHQTVETSSFPSVLPIPMQDNLNHMLSNYRTWNQQIYPELPLDQKSIRLVEILPGTSNEIELNIIKVSLDEIRDAYEALSYVWGLPDPAKTVRLNGLDVTVNPNLFDALLSLRQTDVKRRIWIDAICINQKNLRERSIEVRKMGKIYHLAKAVVVFLGTSGSAARGSPVNDVFSFLRRRARETTAYVSNRQDDEVTDCLGELCREYGLDKWRVCRGFLEMCSQRWWSRVWTRQEFYLASNEPIWYWGCDSISNAVLKQEFKLLVNLSLPLLAKLDAPEGFQYEVAKIMGKPHTAFKKDVEHIFDLISRRLKTNGYDVPRRLYGELSAHATDSRDLVYGLREIFDPVFRRVFVPDYFMRPELLFACLAVFLIQYECWADVLWWYPYRYASVEDHLPTWLPDFSRRADLSYLEPVPMKLQVDETPYPKMIILNHRLHAEGYVLDTMYGHRHLDKSDGHKILQELWQFDHILNANLLCHRYILMDEDKDDASLSIFLRMCKDSLIGRDRALVSASKGAILRSTTKSEEEKNLPLDVAECLPYFDILMWHCLGHDELGISKVLAGDDTRSSKLFQNLFRPKMSNTFCKTMASFFIGACIFDWDHLSILLDRFPGAPMWSQTNNDYWFNTVGADDAHRAAVTASAVGSYITHILHVIIQTNWGASWHYQTFCTLILLDCDSHASIAPLVTKLRDAAVKLREIAFGPQMERQLQELASKNESVETRLRNYDAVVERFKGRFLIWTDHGFRGVTAPGVEYCCNTKPIVLMLDGLSFPVIVRDFHAKTGEGRLVGCAIIQGVDMLCKEVKQVRLPEDFVLGKKEIFKFR